MYQLSDHKRLADLKFATLLSTEGLDFTDDRTSDYNRLAGHNFIAVQCTQGKLTFR